MKIQKTELQAIELTELSCLDPITVLWHDLAPGKGKIIIACAGEAWTGVWGGMGNYKVCGFFATCEVDYLVGRLQQSRAKRSTSAEHYLGRVIVAVQEALRAWPSQQEDEKSKTANEYAGYITDFIDFLLENGVDDSCAMTFIEDNSPDNRYALTFASEHPGLARKVAVYFGCPEDEIASECTSFENSDFWAGDGCFRHLADALTKSQGAYFDVELTLADLKELAGYEAEAN